MTARLTRLANGLTGAVVTVALLAGPPWLLTTFVGPPIPTSWPDLDTFRQIATIGVTDTFVITTLAVIVWVAWTQLAVAIAAETVAAIRRRPPTRLPLLPGTQPLAARLVAATLLLVTALQPRPLAATPLELPVATPAAAVIDDQPDPPAPTRATPTPATPSTRKIVVGARDSWWSVAETHLGDGLRWREIRDLNLGHSGDQPPSPRNSTDLDLDRLEPGRPLLVPDDGHDTHPEPPNSDAEAMPEVWEVRRGEHFWHIAETTLAQAWDRTPTDAEIVPYWQQLIDHNRQRLAPPGDPNLIHPGQRFELPPVPDDPLTPTPTENDDTLPQPDHELPPPALPDLPEVPDTGRADDTTTTRPASPPSEKVAPDRDVVDLTLDLADEPTGEQPDRPAATPLGVPAGAASAALAAAVAAAGVTALVRRRRRTLLQQRPTGWRLPTPAPEVQHQLATLEHVAPEDEALETLAALLATLPPEIDPPLVVIHDHGPISLIVLDDTCLPAPWTPDPGDPGEPARFTARLGDRGPCRSIGLPLLVTLGHTGASTVLANLGALGVLAVDGPPDQVAARLRAMTLELATSRLAGPLEVTVCDDDLFTDLDQTRTAEGPRPAIAATVADTKAGIIDEDRLPRMVVCHSPTAVELPADAARFCGLLTPGTIDPKRWGLRLDGDHGWLHIPDGDPQPLALPEIDPTLIADELDTLTDGALTHETDEPTDPADAATTQTAPYCQVGVLGPLVVTCDGTPPDRLTPIARQLLTYLATHRDGVTLEQLDATIWPELPPSTGGQRARTALARLRTTLGDGPDGQPLLPRRNHAGDPVELSTHVGTDLDHAFALLTAARHTDTPAQALDARLAALALIRGQPFTGLTVSWSVDIEQRAIAQLQDAALTVANQLTDVGEYDRAVWAIRQGLKLCDPTEPLYVAWAHIEHARGRNDRIPHLWRRLCRLYADDADEIASIMTSPTTDTEAAFTQLMTDR